MEKWLPLFTALTNLVTIAVVLYIRWSLTDIKADVTAVAANVQKVELATNSMKDALVASTARASLAEGKAQGREEEENRQDERPALRPVATETPVPVKDDRVAKAAEQGAEAAKDTAEATKRIAVATEKRIEKPAEPRRKS